MNKFDPNQPRYTGRRPVQFGSVEPWRLLIIPTVLLGAYIAHYWFTIEQIGYGIVALFFLRLIVQIFIGKPQ